MINNSLLNNTITSTGASILFDSLRQSNSVISALGLSYNQIDDKCMKQLGEFIKVSKNLETLDLRKNRITDKGIEILSNYIIGNTTLKRIKLNRNNGITDQSITCFFKMIELSQIAELYIRETLITQSRVLIAALAHKAMKNNSNELKISDM